MNGMRDHGKNRLNMDQLALIDERCDRYEREWNPLEEPRIEDYLAGTDETVRGALWLELAVTDHELRLRAGQNTSLDRYLPSCPDGKVLLELSTDFGLPPGELTRGAPPGSFGIVPDPQTAIFPAPVVAPVKAETVAATARGDQLRSTVGDVDAPTMPPGLRSTQAAHEGQSRQSPGPGATLAVGSTVGEYELLAVIAQGGMGVVYKARQVGVNRIVALKMIRSGAHATDREIRLFRREAEAVAALDHPHIVPIFEVGVWQGLLFSSMKYIVGRNLQESLEEFRNQPRAIAKLISIVARAVHHAHQRGILHRDLKPSNILIDRAGLPYVIDFGLARRVGVDGDTQVSNSIVGTLNYMSPEQARGNQEEITTATDLYGLGAILYALLVGKAPYAASSVVDLVRMMIDYEPMRPHVRDKTVDPDLEIICLKCLDKEPKRRYASANDLADDLDRWLDGKPILARPASTTERIVKYVRRRRVLSAMIGLLVATAMIGSGGIVWQWSEAVAARYALQIAFDKAQKSEEEALKNEAYALNLAYAARINLAERNWRDANVAGVERQLADTQPRPGKKDLRGFEWHYLSHLAQTANRTLVGHEREVWTTVYSKDGKLLASASQDGAIKLWDPASGQLIRTLTASKPVHTLVFVDGSSRLASAGVDGSITLWDVATGQPARVFEGHSAAVSSIDVSPDSKLLASSSGDGTIRIWVIETGRSLHVIKDHPPKSLANISFSPDGKLVGAAGGGTANPRLWDVGTGARARVLSDEQGNRAYLLIFMPDGKQVATTGEDGSIKLWHVSRADPIRTIYDAHNREIIRGMVFSPDGKSLACIRHSGQAVELWDVASGSLVRIFRGHTRSLLSVAFAPDGLHLATSSNDATVRIWNRAQEQEARSLTDPDAVFDVAFAPDGAFLITGGRDKTLRLWDVASEKLVRVFEGHAGKVRCVVVSPDGRFVASASDDQTARIWDVATGKLLHTLKGHTAPIFTLAFRGDGQILASGSDDHTIRLWNVAAGESTQTLAGHPGPVNYLAFSAGDKTLVSGGGDGFVMTWDAESGSRRQVFLAETAGVVGMTLSPDGRWLATSGYDRMITIWDRKTQQPVHRLGGHGLIARRLTFSPDSLRLASAGADRTIRIWDPIFGKELLVLRGHDQSVWSIAFSPDGRRIASASSDHTVRIWDSGNEAKAAQPPPLR